MSSGPRHPQLLTVAPPDQTSTHRHIKHERAPGPAPGRPDSGKSERSRAGSDLHRYAGPMGAAMARTWSLAGPPVGNFRSSRRRSSARGVVSERGSFTGHGEESGGLSGGQSIGGVVNASVTMRP